MITSEWPSSQHPELVPFIVRQVESLRETGVDVEVFPFRGNKNPINYVKAWLSLRRAYDISHFDVVHAQFGQSGLLALPAQVPLVLTLRGSDVHGIVGPGGNYTLAGLVLRVVTRFVARRSHAVILVSEHLTKYLPRRLLFHVIPSGINLECFHPMSQEEARRRLGLPLHRHLVLFAADPCRPVKRYHLAQEAVSLLNTQLDIELITVSAVPHEMMAVYMNACDVLVLTSKHEGSPSVIKEALACGLPVVSVDVGDVRQRIGEVQGCILCADDSPETIAQGLAQVLQARSRINAAHAIADVDERIVAQRIIDVYHATLTGGKRLVPGEA